MTTEETILLCAAGAQGNDRFEDLLRGASPDWTTLVEAALAHGVAGLLCERLLDADPALVPRDILSACAEHLRRQHDGNALAAEQLVGILAHLRESGIEAIPFKGPSLAMAAYGTLALRSFRDLDFLIRPGQAQRCIEALRALGYVNDRDLTPRQRQAFFAYAGEEILFGPGLPLEPHWHFAPRTLSYELDYEGIWSRAGVRPFLGRTIPSLSPEDELTVLCLHGGKERWGQLKWIADVAAFVGSHPALDWTALRRRAHEAGVARVVRLGLGLAQSLLAAPLPAAGSAWVGADRAALRLRDQLGKACLRPRREASIYDLDGMHWRMRERAGDRLRYLLRTLTQPRTRHFGSLAIPDPLFGLYVPYKVVHDYAALPLWRQLKRLRNAFRHDALRDGRRDAAG